MPSDKDFSVGAVGSQLPGVPSGAIYAGGVAMGSTISKKPCYLITLDVAGKSKGSFFITLDKPEILNGFVQVKGFYSDESESDIVANFGELVRIAPKEKIVEVYLPWHRIHNMRSLVFNANKPINIAK
jgi:hypothetical protein